MRHDSINWRDPVTGYSDGTGVKKMPVALSLLAAVTLALGACDDAGEDEPVEVPTTYATTTAPEPDPELSVSVSPSPSKSVSVSPSPVDTETPPVPPVRSPDSEGDGPNT